jgi:pSer/pThr/pTyr-binding forkhead associated (FHA) protein
MELAAGMTPAFASSAIPAEAAMPAGDQRPSLLLLGEDGAPQQRYTLDRGEAVIGRGESDIEFPNDPYMSPIHARLEWRDERVWLRDLGSRNGSWIFIQEPWKLTDGDMILAGTQVLRFRRLGYPGPHPPEADATRRFGSSLPAMDIAMLEQVRADGSVRDCIHLSPGRSIVIGRTTGDWIFPYDSTMSGTHAELMPEDNEFFLRDTGSRNGVALAVRGERPLNAGTRIMIGQQAFIVGYR